MGSLREPAEETQGMFARGAFEAGAALSSCSAALLPAFSPSRAFWPSRPPQPRPQRVRSAYRARPSRSWRALVDWFVVGRARGDDVL